jgi:hypothetical protein
MMSANEPLTRLPLPSILAVRQPTAHSRRAARYRIANDSARGRAAASPRIGLQRSEGGERARVCQLGHVAQQRIRDRNVRAGVECREVVRVEVGERLGARLVCVVRVGSWGLLARLVWVDLGAGLRGGAHALPQCYKPFDVGARANRDGRIEPARRSARPKHDDTQRLKREREPVELRDGVGPARQVKQDEVVAIAALVDPAWELVRAGWGGVGRNEGYLLAALLIRSSVE